MLLDCCIILVESMCNRYLAEFKTGSERKDAAENTMVAYKAAQVIFFSCIAVLILNVVGWGIMFFIYPIYHSVYCVANSFSAKSFRILPWQSWPPLILLGSGWRSTSQYFIMRSSTLLIVLAVLLSRFDFWIHYITVYCFSYQSL